MATIKTCDWCERDIDSRHAVSLFALGAGGDWPYVDLHRSCLREIRDEVSGTADDRRAADQARWDARHGWKMFPEHERFRAILDTLGDDALTVQEVADNFADHLPEWGANRSWHYSNIYPLLQKLRDAGEVDRKAAEVRGGRPVWRYFRRSELSGPIADIAAQFTNDEKTR